MPSRKRSSKSRVRSTSPVLHCWAWVTEALSSVPPTVALVWFVALHESGVGNRHDSRRRGAKGTTGFPPPAPALLYRMTRIFSASIAPPGQVPPSCSSRGGPRNSPVDIQPLAFHTVSSNAQTRGSRHQGARVNICKAPCLPSGPMAQAAGAEGTCVKIRRTHSCKSSPCARARSHVISSIPANAARQTNCMAAHSIIYTTL